jgi:hypothetical protein
MSGASLPFWSKSNENSLVVKFCSEICRLLVFQYSIVTGTLAYAIQYGLFADLVRAVTEIFRDSHSWDMTHLNHGRELEAAL